MYRILICEDDPVILSAMSSYLSSWGYDVRGVKNFKNVMSDFDEFAPELVLLDISLPFFNGYHWCTEIRKVSNVPVVFISSASDNMNIVMAVNMGGDDFLAKPFVLDVLNAKVSAGPECRGAVLNMEDATLSYGGERIELTKNEYRILEVLMGNAGKIVSRAELMDKLWETDSFVDDNTLTVNITRLRNTLADHGLTDFIKTKKGIGYIIENDGDAK